MKFIKIIKNNFLLIARLFILSFPRRRESVVFNNNLDSRRSLPSVKTGGGNDRGKNSSKNLPPTTYNLQPSSGFTLIETLVAISILMIAVASPLTIAQKGLSSAIYAKDQVIASYLAQDAIEYLRNKIDLNPPTTWLDGISGDTNCGTACTVDTYSSGGILNCDGTCPALYYDGVVYTQTGTKLSSFTRSVIVTEKVGGVEALITVTMSWQDKSKLRNLTVNTRIYNWR